MLKVYKICDSIQKQYDVITASANENGVTLKSEELERIQCYLVMIINYLV